MRPKLHIVELVRKQTQLTVQQGPFAGLKLDKDTVELTKLLGLYERELHRTVESIARLPIGLVVNVGAADGYYASGLARLLPGSRSIAFEADAKIRAALQRTLSANGLTSRVQVLGKCEIEDLAAALGTSSGALVVCDVEGYEAVLLDPSKVERLKGCYILVELHDLLIPGVSDLISRRFSASHSITEIKQADRTADDFPYTSWYLKLLPARYRQWAVDEGRAAEMTWFWMQPLARQTSG
jgi:hypothetical protein